MISLEDLMEGLLALGVPFNGGGGGGGTYSQMVFASADLNAKTLNDQALFTVVAPAFNFIIPKSVIITTTILTGFTSAPQLTVGSNGSAFDNLIGAGTDFSQLGVLGNSQVIDCSNSGRIAVDTALSMNISAIAVATTMSIRIILLGQGIQA